MVTIETKTISNTKERRDNKRVDDDYSDRYFKAEFERW